MPTKKKAASTPAMLAAADKQRQEWADFKAWKAAQAAPKQAPARMAAPTSLAGKPSRRERFALEDTDEVTTVQGAEELGIPEIAELARQNAESAGQRTKVTHTTTKEAVVFDRRGIAQRVLRSAYLLKLSEPGRDGRPNWFEDCPLCHRFHPETEYDPNACVAREDQPVMIVACPARADCAWEGRVFPEDEVAQGTQHGTSEQLFPMTDDTKRSIGKSLALAHAWAKHPSESLGRGLPIAGQPQAQQAAVA